MNNEKICFVISPIGDEGSETRKRSDLTYEYIIRPVVEKFEYHLTRADYIKEPGIITSQIIDQIFDSSLVIADLSDDNPNVFYELAIRHVIQKPYIQMIQHGQKIPFDITNLRTIAFDIDLKSAYNAKKELFDQIESIENNKFNPDNPITSAIHQINIHKMLTNSENTTPDSISKVVLESVSELRSIVLDLRAEFHNFKLSEKNSKNRSEIIEILDGQILETKQEIDNIEKLLNRDDFKELDQRKIKEYKIQLEKKLTNLLNKENRIINSF